jgi:hypothetical protein
MPSRHWINLRTGTLLVLASVVAALAVLFGNAYATHGHEEAEAEHAEEEVGAGSEAGEEPGHAEDEEEGEGSRSVKIVGSVLISTAGAGLIPLGLLLAGTRRREEDERTPLTEAEAPVPGPPEPADAAIEPVLRPALALLSAGAAVIHFVVIPGHWDEYWAQGLFFIGAAIAQLLWAVWIVVAPSRLIYLAGAAGNAAIAALWVVTRTAGVPAGPGAGEREAVEFADTLATAFEVVLVIGAIWLAKRARVRPVFWPTGALAASALVYVAVAGLTAVALLALVEVWAT